ncbi:hypothetical protein T439DRAFT_233116 [Meredithblackwellia eburnea MCA 4105]
MPERKKSGRMVYPVQFLLGLSLFLPVVVSQATVAGVTNDLNTVSGLTTEACTSSCSTFQAGLTTCINTGTDPLFTTCVCATTFSTALTSCTGCLSADPAVDQGAIVVASNG